MLNKDTLTAHQLARLLLNGPDLPVVAGAELAGGLAGCVGVDMGVAVRTSDGGSEAGTGVTFHEERMAFGIYPDKPHTGVVRITVKGDRAWT